MGEGESVVNLDKVINPEKLKRFTWSKEKLDPVKWNYPEIKGFDYKFQFPQNPERQEGDAQVIYRNLDFFGRVKGDKLFTALTERSIKSTGIIMHINEFNPNGRGTKEEIKEKYAKRGFGSEILDFLTQEGKENGADVLYVFTGRLEKEEMADFIKNRGFEPVDKKNPRNMRFFKILDQKN